MARKPNNSKPSPLEMAVYFESIIDSTKPKEKFFEDMFKSLNMPTNLINVKYYYRDPDGIERSYSKLRSSNYPFIFKIYVADLEDFDYDDFKFDGSIHTSIRDLPNGSVAWSNPSFRVWSTIQQHAHLYSLDHSVCEWLITKDYNSVIHPYPEYIAYNQGMAYSIAQKLEPYIMNGRIVYSKSDPFTTVGDTIYYLCKRLIELKLIKSVTVKKVLNITFN